MRLPGFFKPSHRVRLQDIYEKIARAKIVGAKFSGSKITRAKNLSAKNISAKLLAAIQGRDATHLAVFPLNDSQITEADLSNVVVHPCVINNQPHIVYPRGLEQASPGLYTRLCDYFQGKGYKLKEDQRSGMSANDHGHERRKWMPVLFFSASILFESAANADVEIDLNSRFTQQQSSVQLQIIQNDRVRQQIAHNLSIDNHPDVRLKHKVDLETDVAGEVFKILKSRYTSKESDPEYIENDLREIANYYSDFPETIKLLRSLKDKDWTLQFDEDNWYTTGSGNMLEVKNVVVHFNTRSAAQLRLNNGCKNNPVCIASPADALLHELLHAHSMLVKSEEFLSQGGMNNVIYPYQHEYRVIDAEKNLYAAMSKHDKIKRPQRSEHTGRNIKANCPTCIK